jgi:hypothetical protein
LKDPKTNDFQIASGMDDIIELDYKNPAMRQAMIDAMKFWVKETNIDGFRCDLASWVEVDFWQQARPEVEKIKPLFFIGEFDELDNPDYGKVFDASYSWTWMHKTADYYKKDLPLSELKDLLIKYSAIGDESMRAWFTTNHDENTWNGTEYEKYGLIAKPLAVFSATWNGVPLLYSGQELPNMKRLEFFEKDVINWNGESMSDVYLSEAFEDKGAKIQFQYGFMDLWEFFCELVEEIDEKPAVNYPITVFRFGNMPLKAPSKTAKKMGKNSVIPLLDDEFGSFEDEFNASSFADEDEDDFDDEEDDYNDNFDEVDNDDI